MSEYSSFSLSLSLRQQEARAAAAGMAVMADLFALQSEQSLASLEHLPVRQLRVLTDLTASVQCQVLDVLDSAPRQLKFGVRAI